MCSRSVPVAAALPMGEHRVRGRSDLKGQPSGMICKAD